MQRHRLKGDVNKTLSEGNNTIKSLIPGNFFLNNQMLGIIQ